MIFGCPKCDADLSIPDERIQNRILKVRCRNCKHIFYVKDPALDQAVPDPSKSTPPVPADDEVWFYAKDQQAHGPVSIGIMRHLIVSAQVLSSTLVWREGMGEWQPLAMVPELKRVLTETASPKPSEDAPIAPGLEDLDAAEKARDPFDSFDDDDVMDDVDIAVDLDQDREDDIARKLLEEEEHLQQERAERREEYHRKKVAEEEAERKTKEEEEQEQARLEAERQELEEAERKAAEEAEEQARLEAERQEQEEAERKAAEEAEEQARLEAERQELEEAERKAAEEAEEQARLEAERQEQEEAERKAAEEVEESARGEAEEKAKLEALLAEKEEELRKMQAEAEALALEKEAAQAEEQTKADAMTQEAVDDTAAPAEEIAAPPAAKKPAKKEKTRRMPMGKLAAAFIVIIAAIALAIIALTGHGGLDVNPEEKPIGNGSQANLFMPNVAIEKKAVQEIPEPPEPEAPAEVATKTPPEELSDEALAKKLKSQVKDMRSALGEEAWEKREVEAAKAAAKAVKAQQPPPSRNNTITTSAVEEPPTPDPVPDAGLFPDTLAQSQIRSVINRNLTRIKFCYDSSLRRNPNISGRLVVSFVIENNGGVSSVGIKTRRMKGTELEGCVKKAILRWRFPKFSGDPIHVDYPFVFTAY